MKNKSLFAVMFLLLVMMSLPAWAAVYCVRAGATGAANGSNWNDAYPTLPATLERGSTYYIADGTYNSYVFDDPESGSLAITIKKATLTDHGPGAGWQDSMAQGPSYFTSSTPVSTFEFRTGYYTIDGQEGTNRSGHGIKAYNPNNLGGGAGGAVMSVYSGFTAPYLTIRHVEMQSAGWGNGGRTRTIYLAGTAHHFVMQYCYIHESGQQWWYSGAYSTDIFIEHCSFKNIGSGDQAYHSVGLWFAGVISPMNVVIRFNVFENVHSIGGTGYMTLAEGTTIPSSGYEIYGNVFLASSDLTGGSYLIGNTVGNVTHGIKFYNNTIVGLRKNVSRILITNENAVGNDAQNNLWVNCEKAPTFTNITQSNNSLNVLGADIFRDAANGDFRLSKPITTGVNLGAPYNMDPDGHTRTTWSVGAYEYVDGLHLNSPVGGETWKQGTNHAITWNSSGVMDPVKIELYKGSALDHVIAENVPVSESPYAWQIPSNQATGNDYTVKLTAGAYSDTSDAFSIAAPGAPMAQTLAAQPITTNSAVLRGTVHSMGSGTSYHFEYGLTIAYGLTTPDATLNAEADQTTVQAAISGLNASTTYHFRLVATNSAGATQGSDLTFATNSSGGGGSGGNGNAGGGGGGCFVTAAQAGGITGRCLEWLDLWLLPTVLLLAIVLGGVWSGKRKKIIMGIGVTAGVLIMSVAVEAATTRFISQYGITWTFDKEYEYGLFVNGDYWVLGPATVTRIEPDFDGRNNGWQVNPLPGIKQGLQDGCYNGAGTFDASLVPALPYRAGAGESILKTVYAGKDRPCLRTAAVLTVVESTPPNNGADVFRPPYVGVDKPYYFVGDLHTEVLPSLAPVSNTPSLDSIAARFRRVQMDHIPGGLSQGIRPIDNLPDYGAEIGSDEAQGALRLMLNDPIESKKPALIAYIQNGIDIHHMILNGQAWPAGGGEQPCHTLPWVFAATLFDNQAMKNKIAETAAAARLYNDYHAYRGRNGRALYGNLHDRDETRYWALLATGAGTKTMPDFYEYIDTKEYVKCCVAQPWKGMALAFHLMPRMKSVWNNEILFDFADRWVIVGQWTQPDPCAPAPVLTGAQWANRWAYGYEITWGPDPNRPGECIPDVDPGDGIGRIPSYHGDPDSGNYSTQFIRDMWNAYRNQSGIFSITAPLAGTIWVRGLDHEITWYASGVTAPVKIELFKNNANPVFIAANVPVVDCFFTWTIPANQAAGNDYTVKLTAGEHESTSGNFSIAAPGTPAVTTEPAMSVTPAGAVLRGRVHSMGYQTTYYFEYGLTTAYGSETAEVNLAAGDETLSVQVAISGLNASTTYHFRLVATNSEGTSQGNDLAFTTSFSGGGGGGSGEAGGGGGGCFVTAAQAGGITGRCLEWLDLWLLPTVLLLAIVLGGVWSGKRKKIIMGIGVTALALLAVCFAAQAETYYVDINHPQANDANTGTTVNSAWKTIAKANQTLQPGDTVFIRGGIYVGQIIQPNNSGISDNARIVYANYSGEDVLIRDSAYGIYLYKKSYITVNGIRFYSLRRFLRIYAGHYNVISHCDFDTRSPDSGDWAGGRIANDFNDTTPASEPSTHNWVHHCRFNRWVYGAYAEHRGSILDVGNNERAGDSSSYNLIEDNTFAYGGHHTLGVYSPFNVIRRNYFHNETNPENWSYEGYRASITEGPGAGRCLYEGNRYGHAGASGMALRSPYNIFRFNVFYHNGSGGIQVVSSAAGIDHADYNRIYHNTFYHNGHLATDPGFQGGMYFANWSNQSPVGNVVKCNLFFDNKNGSVTYEGNIQPQVVANNWDQNQVNPGLADLTDGGPDNPDLPDLRLNAGSAAIDQANGLTIITGPNGTGTSFQVADAGYFMDGWGVLHVGGDEIQLQGSAQRARITNVNYETNVITVDRILIWAQNQGISLAYQGTAPDLGAHEYVPAISLDSPAGGELWVRGFSHDIKWSSSGVTEPVKIELIKSGNTTVLADNVLVTSGTAMWQIPTNQTAGSDYSIKISAGSYADTSDSFIIAVPGAPIVQTLAAQSVTTNSALLRGTVHPMGLETTYRFEYGLTDSYGSETAEVNLAAGDATMTVQAAIPNLNASTIYHFRLMATNSEGTSYGNDMSFTTSGGGGGGSSSGDSGGGGGGGCFIASARSLSPWFMLLGLSAGCLIRMRRRAKRLQGIL